MSTSNKTDDINQAYNSEINSRIIELNNECKKEEKLDFNNFEFLLEHFSESQLYALEEKIPDIQKKLYVLVKNNGLGKVSIINIVNALIEK